MRFSPHSDHRRVIIHQQVWAAYFSGTDTTKTIVTTIAQECADAGGSPAAELNFTPPQAREEHYTFAPTDLVICGTPVIAGRVPNVLLPFLSHGFTGNHALAVPVVLFGNRNYDDALMELREILEADGLRTVAGGAFVGEHSFSTILALVILTGRIWTRRRNLPRPSRRRSSSWTLCPRSR